MTAFRSLLIARATAIYSGKGVANKRDKHKLIGKLYPFEAFRTTRLIGSTVLLYF
jgi:hypothetical protein